LDYKDYYATLSVKKDASQDDIQKAYKKLARKFHPDVNKDPQAEVKFKEIGEAYEVLKDPDKRQKYDQYGSAWNRARQSGGSGVPPGWNVHYGDSGAGGFDFGDLGGMGGGGERFSSFFDMLFGGGGPGGQRRGAAAGGPAGFGGFGGQGGPQVGGNAEATLPLTVEEAVQGGEKEIAISDPSTGQRRSLSVKIPAGVRSGQKIRLAGQGPPGLGGAAGDLLLKVEIQPDSRFRVDGADIQTTVPVAPWEAALGGEAEVETPTGPVRVRIPAGSSSGRKIRLRGRGLSKQGGDKGDLLAEIRVVIPDPLSPRERELFEQLAAESEFRPREREM
jgi:curved DNA-binding protein